MGAAVQTLSNSAKTSGITVNSRITTMMLEAVTRRMFGSGLYLGGRFGGSLNSINIASSTTDLSASAMSLAVAPVIGYEIDVAQAVSLGLDVNWTVIGGTTFKFPTGTKIETTSQGAVMMQGEVIFHL